MKRSKQRVRRSVKQRKPSPATGKRAADYQTGYDEGYRQGEAAGAESFLQLFDGTSIIIPTCNQLSELERCINSIVENTDPAYEVIVVDCDSKDQTARYLNKMAGQIRFRRLPEESSCTAAINEGLMMAKGTSLLLLDSGLTVGEGWLEELLQVLNSDKRTGLVGAVMKNRPNLIAGYEKAVASAVRPDSSSGWTSADRLDGLCVLFRRELWELTGYLDERFDQGSYAIEDYCIRTRLQGRLLAAASHALVYRSETNTECGLNGQDTEAAAVNKHRFMDKWGNANKVLHEVHLRLNGNDIVPTGGLSGEAAFYPQGIAVKGKGRAVFWVDEDVSHPVEGEWPFPVTTLSNADLRRWKPGSRLAAREVVRHSMAGTKHGLVTEAEDGTVYYLEHGIKRKIVSKTAANAWGLLKRPSVPWNDITIGQLPEGLPVISPSVLRPFL